MKRIGATGLALAVVMTAASAFAQDVATAAAAFDKGVADMQEGKFDSACPLLAESLRLDRRPGTLFTLAECFAKAGKTASAVARYQDYLDWFARLSPDEQSKQRGREKTAQEQKDKLQPLVPLLTLKLPENAPAGTEVKRDGQLLGGAMLGLPLPVDPGAHTITAQAPGGPVSSESVKIDKGEKKVVTLKLQAEGAKPVAGAPPAAAPAAPAGAPDQGASSGSGQRTAGLVIGGVGVAALVVGGITGAMALGGKSSITDNCDLKTKVCTSGSDGLDAVSSAQGMATVSTVFFIAGAVLAAGGTVVFLTAPKTKSSSSTALRVDAGPVTTGLAFAAPCGGFVTARGSF